MKDYITITVSKQQAVRLLRDLLAGTTAFRWRAITTREEAKNYPESAYFQARTAEDKALAEAHEAVLAETLTAVLEAGITYYDIYPGDDDDDGQYDCTTSA